MSVSDALAGLAHQREPGSRSVWHSDPWKKLIEEGFDFLEESGQKTTAKLFYAYLGKASAEQGGPSEPPAGHSSLVATLAQHWPERWQRVKTR